MWSEFAELIYVVEVPLSLKSRSFSPQKSGTVDIESDTTSSKPYVL